MTTRSAVNLSTDAGIVTLNGVQCRSTNIIVGRGAADMYLRNIPMELVVTVMDGDIDCGYAATSEYGLLLRADASDAIYYKGEQVAENPWEFSNSPGANAQEFTANNGTIALTIMATGISGRFDALSDELEKEAETADLDAKVVETQDTSDSET